MPTIVLTSGTRWYVPADCQIANISAIGGGNNTTGAAFAKSVGVSLTPGSTVYISIGAGLTGSSTWFNKAANSAPTVDTNGVKAAGGAIIPPNQSGNSVYTTGSGNFYLSLIHI